MSTTGLDQPHTRPWLRSSGFTLVSALFVLVVLAALGAAMASMAVRAQLGSAAEIDAARALQSARGGLEWAAWQVLRNPAPPAAAPGCFAATSLALAGLAPFTVTVSCNRSTAADGAVDLVFYELVATACNATSAGACPSTAALQPTYVERQLRWTLVR